MRFSDFTQRHGGPFWMSAEDTKYGSSSNKELTRAVLYCMCCSEVLNLLGFFLFFIIIRLIFQPNAKIESIEVATFRFWGDI